MASISITTAIETTFNEAYSKIKDFVIEGVSSDIAEGSILTLNLNFENYDYTLSGTSFEFTIPADDLLDLDEETQYTLSIIYSGETLYSTQVSTGEFKMGIHEINAHNVVETSQRRFVSDEEMDTMSLRITDLEEIIFQQDYTPTAEQGAGKGDLWLDTSNDSLKVYREYPIGSGALRWEPLLYKWDDVVDGGTW